MEVGRKVGGWVGRVLSPVYNVLATRRKLILAGVIVL